MRTSRGFAVAVATAQLLLVAGFAAPGVRAAAVTPTAPAVAVSSGSYGPSQYDTIRFFTPSGSGPKPAVLFIHGGAWGRSQPEGPEYAFGRRLAARTGWVVVTIGYPTWTAPEVRVEPTAIREALVDVADDPAVDPHRIALWGESSGGQLALLSAYRDRPDHVDLVALTKRLAAAGVRHETVHVPGADHSFPLEFDHPAHSPRTVEGLAIRFLQGLFSASR